MKVGLGPISLADTSREQLAELSRAAVAASFDSLWVSESRARSVGGGLAAAAMLAQLVAIRVGAVVDFGGYHPLYAAEDIAVADITSQGRLEVLLRGGSDEQLRLLVDAIGGAHLQFEGEQLRVPARLDANQPAPSKLALNPRPAQPAVPLWVEDIDPQAAALLGVGVATSWHREVPQVARPWPPMLLCPGDVRADELLQAAGGRATYFLIGANTPAAVAEAGRRLMGPLRMPDFPDWINAT
jgi:alkanesulfonate monooxygenase SsuD/methylene tetrahydromethanopterin reductase-like flavin-dependent oxidoreductase (luciferase family)